MPTLFAFWTVDAHGHPTDPDAADPWGDRSPFDALEYDRETVGPFLTVTDEATGAVHFAGDVSAALRAFAAEVAEQTGCPPRPATPPVDAALEACRRIADRATDEHAREAVCDWATPDPDTWRHPRRMPEHVRRTVRDGAERAGRQAAADALRDHLLARVLPARRAA